MLIDPNVLDCADPTKSLGLGSRWQNLLAYPDPIHSLLESLMALLVQEGPEVVGHFLPLLAIDLGRGLLGHLFLYLRLGLTKGAELVFHTGRLEVSPIHIFKVNKITDAWLVVQVLLVVPTDLDELL